MVVFVKTVLEPGLIRFVVRLEGNGEAGVVGRLFDAGCPEFVGPDGVVGALTVVVGRGSWLGGPAGSPVS